MPYNSHFTVKSPLVPLLQTEPITTNFDRWKWATNYTIDASFSFDPDVESDDPSGKYGM